MSHVPRPHNHPSVWCYKAHGCRCMLCRIAVADYQRSWRLGFKPTEKEHNHPSLHCYKMHGCRCQPCKTLNAKHSKRVYDNRFKLKSKALSQEEIERLRKLVGYKEEDSA